MAARLVLDELDFDFPALAARLRVLVVVVVVAVVGTRSLARDVEGGAGYTRLGIWNTIAGRECGHGVYGVVVLWRGVVVFGHNEGVCEGECVWESR